jgi:hypothetical protein
VIRAMWEDIGRRIADRSQPGKNVKPYLKNK